MKFFAYYGMMIIDITYQKDHRTMRLKKIGMVHEYVPQKQTWIAVHHACMRIRHL